MAKAGRPKRGRASLPDWFDIEKYRAIKDAKAGGWFQQLAPRAALFDYINQLKNQEEDVVEWSKEAIPLIKEDPIRTSERAHAVPTKKVNFQGRERDIMSLSISAIMTAWIRKSVGVRDIGLNDINRLAGSLKKDWQIALAAQLSWRFIELDDLPAIYREIRISIPWADDFFPKLFDGWEAPIKGYDLKRDKSFTTNPFHGNNRELKPF